MRTVPPFGPSVVAAITTHAPSADQLTASSLPLPVTMLVRRTGSPLSGGMIVSTVCSAAAISAPSGDQATELPLRRSTCAPVATFATLSAALPRCPETQELDRSLC